MSNINFIKPIPPKKQKKIHLWFHTTLLLITIFLLFLTIMLILKRNAFIKNNKKKEELNLYSDKLNKLSHFKKKLKVQNPLIALTNNMPRDILIEKIEKNNITCLAKNIKAINLFLKKNKQLKLQKIIILENKFLRAKIIKH